MDATDIIILFMLAAAVVWIAEENGADLSTSLDSIGGLVDQGVNAFGDTVVSETADGSDTDTLARTIRGEAANQSSEAKLAVGSVIMNRVKDAVHYPSEFGSITAICKQPGQFDCWFPQLGSSADYQLTTKPWTNSASDIACLTVAKGLVAGTLTDNTGGAEFYYDSRLGAAPTAWGAVEETATFGTLTFYRRQSI